MTIDTVTGGTVSILKRLYALNNVHNINWINIYTNEAYRSFNNSVITLKISATCFDLEPVSRRFS